MRLFTAIELRKGERKRLADVRVRVDRTGFEAGKFSWIRSENLHVTLKFLGEVADDQVKQVCDVLGEIKSAGPMKLRIEGLTFFPPHGFVQVFVARLGGDADRLTQLHAAIEQSLEPLGFPRERRAYTAHVTMGRARRGRRVPGIVRKLVAEPLMSEGEPFEVDSFVLFESTLKATGSEYHCVARFPLR